MAGRRKKNATPVEEFPTFPAEQLLIDALPELHGPRVLCCTLGRGQFAAQALRQLPGALVVCHEFDIYLAGEIRNWIASNTGAAGEPTAGEGEACVDVVTTADFPEREFDLVALPIDPRGEAELARELLQTAHQRLVQGGRLLAATSNPEDQWLHAEMRKLFAKVTRRPSERGVLYLATKVDHLKKIKRFECDFAFRDLERLIHVSTRPGVFSHRSLDAGARALINTMSIQAGDRVVDLGCGSGAVTFAAAFRAAGVQVVALDSHARAIDCTRRGALRNGLENVTTRLDAEGDVGEPGTFNVVVANPPYYSDFRIAEIFLQGGWRALKPGGKLFLVTKALTWFETRLPELFLDVKKHPHRLYTVFEATKAGG
jgi:16S rRNA G1207 methylase RsmC